MTHTSPLYRLATPLAFERSLLRAIALARRDRRQQRWRERRAALVAFAKGCAEAAVVVSLYVGPWLAIAVLVQWVRS